MKRLLPLLLLLVLLCSCSQLETIPYCCPEQTPESFCDMQPCMEIGSTGIIIIQPTSTAIVYFLAGLTIWVGFYFLKIKEKHRSRYWWGIAMILGGVAAVLAGSSYQAFGYMLKCAGREACIWTNWLEIIYNTLSVASFNAMLVAVSISCTKGTFRKILCGYAAVNSSVHLVVTMVGALLPNKFMISFELLVLFVGPTLLFFLALNLIRFIKYRDTMDLALLCTWVILFGTIIVYYAYMMAGITQDLWADGIWFSENDVLHVAMLAWTLYIPLVLAKRVRDAD